MSSETTKNLLHRVDTALRTHPHLRRIAVRSEAEIDRIILHGEVDSFFLKQMAQEAVRNVEGVSQIDNRLHVSW